MGKLIKNEERGYVKVYNEIIYEPNLSLKAKGLWAYLYAKPNNWEFSAERIKLESKDGLDSVRTGLIELEQFGLLIRRKYQNNKGHWDYDYEILTIPNLENPTAENPSLENPTLEKPTVENPTYNKERLKRKNNKINNNKDILSTSNEDEISNTNIVIENNKAKVCRESHQLVIKFWCEEHKPEYAFEKKDGMAVKRIIEKLYTLAQKKIPKSTSKEAILDMFKQIAIFIQDQNTFYSTMDLCKIDGNFNSIIALMIEAKKAKQTKTNNQIGGRII